jgi:hypothetical protein
VYEYFSAPYGINVSVQGFTFQTNPDNVDFIVSIGDDYSSTDIYYILSRDNLPLRNDVSVDTIDWELRDYQHDVFSSDALPLNDLSRNA